MRRPGYAACSAGLGIYHVAGRQRSLPLCNTRPRKGSSSGSGKIGFDLNDLDKVVPHQANMRIIETAMKYLKQPMEKVIVNIEHHGNTSSASIPIALDEGIREGKSREATRFVWLDLVLA